MKKVIYIAAAITLLSTACYGFKFYKRHVGTIETSKVINDPLCNDPLNGCFQARVYIRGELFTFFSTSLPASEEEKRITTEKAKKSLERVKNNLK